MSSPCLAQNPEYAQPLSDLFQKYGKKAAMAASQDSDTREVVRTFIGQTDEGANQAWEIGTSINGLDEKQLSELEAQLEAHLGTFPELARNLTLLSLWKWCDLEYAFMLPFRSPNYQYLTIEQEHEYLEVVYELVETRFLILTRIDERVGQGWNSFASGEYWQVYFDFMNYTTSIAPHQQIRLLGDYYTKTYELLLP